MDLINSPRWKQYLLRGAAPFLGLIPKAILQIRSYRWRRRFFDWNNARDLYEYTVVTLFKAAKNKDLIDEYARLSDKVAVRQFVAGRVGEKYLTKCYGVWDSANDIDFDALPLPCVVKTNNGCASNLFITERKPEQYRQYRKTLSRWLKYPYGQISGQPHYMRIKPRILAEEYLVSNADNLNELPTDFKFFCIDGEVKFILVYTGRGPNGHEFYNLVFDTDWNLIPGVVKRPSSEIMARPENLEEMLDVATRLSKGFPFVRVDLYSLNGRTVFGEMTFTPDMVTNFIPQFLKDNLPK